SGTRLPPQTQIILAPSRAVSAHPGGVDHLRNPRDGASPTGNSLSRSLRGTFSAPPQADECWLDAFDDGASRAGSRFLFGIPRLGVVRSFGFRYFGRLAGHRRPGGDG